MPDTVIWTGPEHGDGETLAMAFRRLTGRDFDPRHCLWEEWAGMHTAYFFRDGWEVTVGWGGHCTISREGEGGGGGAG